MIAENNVDGLRGRKDPLRPGRVDPDRDPDLGVNLDLTPDGCGKGADGAFDQAVLVRRRHIKLPEARAVGRIKEPPTLVACRQVMCGRAPEDPGVTDEGGHFQEHGSFA